MNALKIKMWTKICPLNLTVQEALVTLTRASKYLRIVRIEARLKYEYA